MDNTDWIESVQEQENGWLVNGNMSVPNDPANRHCQAVLAWIAAGNTPETAPPEPEPLQLPSTEEILLAALLEINELKAKVTTLEGEIE